MDINIIYMVLIWVLLLFLLAIWTIRFVKGLYQKKEDGARQPGITIHAETLFIGEKGLPVNWDEKISAEKVVTASGNQTPETASAESFGTENEKRNHTRHCIQTLVDFVLNGRLFKEVSANYSASGIFLKSFSPNRYQVNEFLTLTFQPAGGAPQKHWGKIVRKSDDGIGVEFVRV